MAQPDCTMAISMGTSMNYSLMFEFEEKFDYEQKKHWMVSNWKVSFLYVGLYMVFIVAGKHVMKSRTRFELRTVLFFWNLFLASFSIFGVFRFLPEVVYALTEYGFQYSVCNNSYAEHNNVTAFWTWLFALSKVPELGDTVFIILRKQPLIFLHWYHHITVLLYTWYSVSEITSSGRWFIVMNYTAHAFMYSYYALKALRIRVPRKVSVFVTAVQITQMVVGLVVNVASYRYKGRGDYCQVTNKNIQISFLMYFSYLILFAHFFYKAYLAKRSTTELKASLKKAN